MSTPWVRRRPAGRAAQLPRGVPPPARLVPTSIRMQSASGLVLAPSSTSRAANAPELNQHEGGRGRQGTNQRTRTRARRPRRPRGVPGCAQKPCDSRWRQRRRVLSRAPCMRSARRQTRTYAPSPAARSKLRARRAARFLFVPRGAGCEHGFGEGRAAGDSARQWVARAEPRWRTRGLGQQHLGRSTPTRTGTRLRSSVAAAAEPPPRPLSIPPSGTVSSTHLTLPTSDLG